MISPLQKTREKAKKIFKDNYIEVFVNCPLAELIKREKLYPKDHKNYLLNLDKRKRFIKSKVSKKIYYKILEQEKNFNSNIYNLRFCN